MARSPTHRPPAAPRVSSTRAFTLVELLLAASITALLAGFIAVIVSNVATSWTRANGRLGADAQARLVLDQLQLDLQGALYRDDGNTWFAAEVLDRTNNSTLWQTAPRNPKPSGAPFSLAMNTASLADARFGQAGVWLRFFTTKRGANTATDPTSASAPVAVGYQIIRYFNATTPTNTDTAYHLYRAEVRPTASTGAVARLGVLDFGYNIRGAPYTTGGTNNNGATTGDARSIQVPGSAGARNLDSVIADNVIDFGIRCYVHDAAAPGGLRLVFPASSAQGQLSNSNRAHLYSSLPAATPNPGANFDQVFPDVVDVMVRILTDDGAARIANLEKNQTPALTAPLKYNGNVQQWWWGVAQENSRVFTRRIVLRAQAL